YEAKNMTDNAIDEYKKALASNPEDRETHYHLASSYEENGMIDEALEEYKKALGATPAWK
ncbi:MAG: tetratricopeptide repeat protein, partial [Planctomycetota bacterium]